MHRFSLKVAVVALGGEGDPEHEALLADSVGLALLVVLETLTPAERLAFVLHDMFAMPCDEIAGVLERTPEAARRRSPRARARASGPAPHARPALVNGAAGAIVWSGDRPVAVVGFTIAQGRIAGIDVYADPARLPTPPRS